MQLFAKFTKKSLVLNIALCGMVFFIVQWVLLPTPFVQGTLNYIYDLVILEDTVQHLRKQQENREQSTGQNATGSSPVCFIDAGEKEFSQWGYPQQFPRKELASYLLSASENEAKVVVLDIVLEFASPDPSDDVELLNVLKKLTQEKSPLKVIFPVPMARVNTGPLPTFVDRYIDKNPNFHRAVLGTVGSESDRQIRFLSYFETFSAHDQPGLVWSVSFLSAALWADKESSLEALKKSILSDQSSNGAPKEAEEYNFQINDQIGLTVSPSISPTDRIRYRLISPGVLSPENKGNLSASLKVPISSLKFSGQLLQDKIVVIGSSAPHLRDMHSTAIGQMAGVYILGNAVHTLAGDLQIDTGFFNNIGIELASLFLCAVFLTLVSPIWIEVSLLFLVFFSLVPNIAWLLDTPFAFSFPLILVDAGLLCVLVEFVPELWDFSKKLLGLVFK